MVNRCSDHIRRLFLRGRYDPLALPECLRSRFHTLVCAGVIGFFCSIGFLGFVSKFNDLVSSYQARKNIKRKMKVDAGLWKTLRSILFTACGAREGWTVFSLCCCLLLRTFGSVWVSQHWGKIVKSIVTRNFLAMRRLLFDFAGATVGLALLNAMLKYYISTLKEQVPDRSSHGCDTR